MAKLSAYGRSELARVERITVEGDSEYRTQHALMSDRKILQRTGWRMVGERKWHMVGWLQYAHLKSDSNVAKWLESKIRAGFTQVGGN